MSSFQIALAIGAAFVGLVTIHVDRAMWWIMAGTASFIASTAYARYGLPLPALVTALCDAAVCLLIYAYARQMWEAGLYSLFLASVFVSIVFLALSIFSPHVANHYLYVLLLEAINWLALLLILGTGIAQWIGEHGGYYRTAGAHHPVHWVERALFAPRKAHPWWR